MRRRSQGIGMSRGILQGKLQCRECSANLAAQIAVIANNQDPAHAVLRGNNNDSSGAG